jgi:predicted dehydrogenase
MASKRIVHIGTGPWGRNYLRTYADLPVTVSIASRDTWRSLIDEGPDGVVVCTPPETHIEMAQYALARDIPVLIEKPLALSHAEALTLQGYSAPVLVNHLYLFSQGYKALKEEVGERTISHIKTVGLGTKSHDGYSVLWDYGPHDIAMALDLLGRMPDKVYARNESTAAGTQCHIELHAGDALVQCSVGIGEKRERKVTVNYEGGEAVFEDQGDEVPGPLRSVIEVFLAAIEGISDSRLGLDLSLKVLSVLEACDRSLMLGEAVTL